MKYADLKVVRGQLDQKLGPLKVLADSGMPRQGWIRTLREALGMSSVQLGRKAGVDQSRVSRLEKAEREGRLNVVSLQKMANALGMRFVYGFVPETTLENAVRQQAQKVIARRGERLDKTMRLEQQGLSDEEQRKAVNDMVDKLLVEHPKDLWDGDNE